MAENTPDNKELLTITDIKRLVTRHLKNWHADAKVDATRTGGAEISTMLTLLIPKTDEGRVVAGLSDLDYWPSNFDYAAGTKLTVKSEGRAIFLPATPQDFFELLDSLEGGHPVPEKFLVPADLRKRSRYSDEDENVEYSDDDLLERLLQLVNTVETIEDLRVTTETSKLFGHTQLMGSGYYPAFNARALFLFTRDAYTLSSKEELDELVVTVNAFEFKKAINNINDAMRAQTLSAIDSRIKELEEIGFQPPKRAGLPIDQNQLQRQRVKAMDTGARRYFVEQVRDAESLETLQALQKDIATFPFINRGELGIVRSVLKRKIGKLTR